MNPKSALIALVTVTAGSLGGMAAYQVAAPATPAEAAAEIPGTAATTGPAAKDRPRPRWAPCKPPAEPQGKRCVTRLVKTVVVPGQDAPVSVPVAPATVSAPLAPPVPAPLPVAPSDDSDHGGEDEDTYGGDDDGPGHDRFDDDSGHGSDDDEFDDSSGHGSDDDGSADDDGDDDDHRDD
jgi:hypothetical protein